jgi:tRNA modification GTPase
MFDETICAPATPPVNSSLAIVRISGPGSLGAVQIIFNNQSKIENRKAVYGSIIDNGSIIDDVVLIYYRAPGSFTGEDMVEIFCHGNQFIVHRIIRLLNSMNIRLADPGEFSRRAFLNGKMGLTEAEAINHVISARSDWELDTAIRQMHGSLARIIMDIREHVIQLKADIETGIDFIEEKIEFISNDDAIVIARSINDLITGLRRRCMAGQRLSHGIDIVITGKPNVGKSSLLNLILNKERAIVSDIPGTTRDIIRESVQINGIHINLIDTAGIDTPSNEIEKMGIELTHKNIGTASIILFVLDASTGIKEQDHRIMENIRGKKTIFIINKIDAAGGDIVDDMSRQCEIPPVQISAKTGEGFKKLEDRIKEILKDECIESSQSFIADLRILNLLEDADKSVGNIIQILSDNEPAEIAAFEMQSLLDILGDITGEITPEDILNSIFSRFCIGK